MAITCEEEEDPNAQVELLPTLAYSGGVPSLKGAGARVEDICGIVRVDVPKVQQEAIPRITGMKQL